VESKVGQGTSSICGCRGRPNPARKTPGAFGGIETNRIHRGLQYNCHPNEKKLKGIGEETKKYMTPNPARILIVDDEFSVRDSSTRWFRRTVNEVQRWRSRRKR